MEITHAFRGEEWLPSAPVHILLWKYLGWESDMPQWAHLPLILKPDGNGKLSKRDGDRLGFPVFAMNWKDPKNEELIKGFRELGFLPEAFINMLAMLGWNDGTDKEIFSLEELIDRFSMERVHKGGAKFDFEKAKWYNHEWIKLAPAEKIRNEVKSVFEQQGITIDDEDKLIKVINLVKDRCTLLTDFYEQAGFLLKTPAQWDIESIKPKWSEAKQLFFAEAVRQFQLQNQWSATDLEHGFKELAVANKIKPGDVLMPLRIMLVGGKFGPGVFDIATLIGKEETIHRIEEVLKQLQA